MKRSFGDFTRGSQLIETFGLMFAAGLKPMLWVTFTLWSVTTAWMVYAGVPQDDLYRCIMRVYAWFWDYMQFNADKVVGIVGPDRGKVFIRLQAVPFYPPVIESWELLLDTLASALTITAIVALPGCFIYTWGSRRLGRKTLTRNHERGATLATREVLVRQIEAFNAVEGRPEREAEYRRIFGPRWRTKLPFASRAELLQAGMYQPYTIAGVPYPWRVEQTHLMAIGTTGTGKSTMLRELVAQIRARGGKAVIFDLTGTFIETFYDPARDVILNPFDRRCPHWSIFNDCETRAEFTAAAEALIPHDGGGGEPFWVQAGRLLLVEACVRLAQHGHATNQALHDHLMVPALRDVHTLLQNSVAAPLTDPQAARMAESIRAVLNTNITAIECLPASGEDFSIKRWVTDEQHGGSILFIAARHVDLSTIKVLLTLWMDTAINTMMSLPPSPRDIRIWFLFDELGALHRLPAIEKGMQTARNFGGAFVLGVHTIAKLRDTYGDKIAETLGSLARTKFILATADYSSAQWCSQQIGNGEWRQMEEGYSYGYSNVRDAVTLTAKRQLEPLVLPDDISKLPDLKGWLVFPQGFPAAPVKLVPQQWSRIARAYEQRPDLQGPNKPLRKQESDGEANDAGRGMETDAARLGRFYARLQDREGLIDYASRQPEREARANVKSIIADARARQQLGLPLGIAAGSPEIDTNHQNTPARDAARTLNEGAEGSREVPAGALVGQGARGEDEARGNGSLSAPSASIDDVRPHERGPQQTHGIEQVEDLGQRDARQDFSDPGERPEADLELGQQ